MSVSHAALVLAKEGSTGLPGKNLLSLDGRPLLLHTLEALDDCGAFSEIYVSTNGEDIARCAHSFGASVIHREEEYARNDRYVATVNHAITHIGAKHKTYTIPMVVQPFREPGLFQRMLSLHAADVDSVVTVTPFEASINWIFTSSAGPFLNSCENVIYGRDMSRRSDLLLIDNAVVSFTAESWRRSDGLTSWPYLGRNVVPVVQKRANANFRVDLNNPDDAEWLEFVGTFPKWKSDRERLQ